MSEIDEVLQLFGFLTLDEVTPEALKRAFKVKIIRAHPDKGGSPELFDRMLNSYMFLTETVQRVNGGRAALLNIISPNELKGLRPNDIVNRIFEEFEQAEFNKKFEEEHGVEERQRPGYSEWLKSGAGETTGRYGDATQKVPSFYAEDLNVMFEAEAKKGKTESPQAIILHPEAMACISGECIGTEIIDSALGDYTSGPFLKPEYTDVYNAFTTNNTICDKIPSQIPSKTFDELLAERGQSITPLNDSELKAIQEYEKKKLETNINNLSKVKEHFVHPPNKNTSLTNWPATNYPSEAYKGFVIDF
jgi:hypothetical protein